MKEITPPILLRLNISKAKEEDFTQYGSSAKSIFTAFRRFIR
jgi:hypothetical protein